MKKSCLLVALGTLLFLVFPATALADEPAKYNFASAQGDKELKIAPGATGTGSVYFYNIDGNRITHISLMLSEAPDGWDITIEPPLGETQVEVSGMPVTVTENLYVEPSELLEAEPQDVPEGMVSIKVPGRGYTLGKSAQVIITIPESAPLGSTAKITIVAEAAWLGQGGSAAIKQSRDFEFNVTVVSGQSGYTEIVIGQGKTTTTATQESTFTTTGTEPNETASPSGEEESGGFSSDKMLLVIAGGVVIVLVVIFVVLLIRRKR